MGNIYSLIDLSQNQELDTVLKTEIEKLEENVKQVDKMLELLNLKCDKIITKVVEIDNKTYDIKEKINSKPSFSNNECNEWDYYDLQQKAI